MSATEKRDRKTRKQREAGNETDSGATGCTMETEEIILAPI